MINAFRERASNVQIKARPTKMASLLKKLWKSKKLTAVGLIITSLLTYSSGLMNTHQKGTLMGLVALPLTYLMPWTSSIIPWASKLPLMNPVKTMLANFADGLAGKTLELGWICFKFQKTGVQILIKTDFFVAWPWAQ